MKLFGTLPGFGGPSDFVPAYLALGLEEVRRRAEASVRSLKACTLCPRECGTDRLADERSVCRTGRHAVVTSAFPHLGEEDCLRGENGSGTIFFGHCALRCVFCQNFDISQGLEEADPGGNRAGDAPDALEGRYKGRDVGPEGTSPGALAGLMLRLQELGCHNINLVTPEHVVPQFLEALVLAAEEGLRLPIVYNTSAYDSLDTLRILDGVIDIYMPDMKLSDPALARRFLKAPDYPEVAKEALLEMHRQVGPLQIGEDGLARRGVLIRHLVMPGLPEETDAILGWIRNELGPDTYVNLMGQYRPAGLVGPEKFPEINRSLSTYELLKARETARVLGLTRMAGA